jgi:transposase
MARAHQDVESLAGTKQAAVLQKHLRHLRKAYAHGNRKLFYDELVSAYLLAFFNPTLRSLRAIDDFSSDEHLHPRRLCRSTMSDANALMDARLLEPLIGQLQRRVTDLRRRDGQLARLLQQVQLIDGSFFNAAADVTWALRQRHGALKTRLDLRLDGSTLLPVSLMVSGKGESESKRAAQRIEPGVIIVADRGFENLDYLQKLLDGGGDFVLRGKSTLNFQPRDSQPLDQTDTDANVLGDRIGKLTGSSHARAKRAVPQQELREVTVFDPNHPQEPVRLITSLLDVPAHVIAQLYRWRWQIELFFRWLKVHAHFEHLISRSRNGMTLGFYVAVIAVLLIYLRTGRSMSKYAFNLLSYVASGQTTLESILPILERRERECQRDRERQAAKRPAKTKV